MTRFQSVTAIAVVELMVLTGVVFAQGPRGGGPWRGSGGPAGFGLPIRELNLTDAQQQQVRDIRDRSRQESQAAGERLRTALEAQRKAVETVPVDESLVRSAAQSVADAQTELTLQQARVRSEIWAVLTPAQQEQAKKLQADRKARMAERRQQRQQRRQQN